MKTFLNKTFTILSIVFFAATIGYTIKSIYEYGLCIIPLSKDDLMCDLIALGLFSTGYLFKILASKTK